MARKQKAKADQRVHLIANDGTDWRSTRSPVNTDEARAESAKVDKAAAGGPGPAASNETTLERTIVQGSASGNAAKEDEEPAGDAKQDKE